MRAACVLLALSLPLGPGPGDLRRTSSTVTIGEEKGRASVDHASSVSGIVRAWVESADFDPTLAVQVGDGARVEDDDSGGRPVPCIDVAVKPGDVVHVEARSKSAGGSARIVVVELAEDDELRAAAAALRAKVDATVAHLSGAGAREARAELYAAAAEAAANPRLCDADTLQKALFDATVQLGQAGEYAAALRAAEALVAVQDERLPPESLRRLRAVLLRGNQLGQLGRGAEARATQRATVDAMRRTLAPTDPLLWGAESDLGASLFQSGDYSGAVERWEFVLKSSAGGDARDARARVQVLANVAVGAYYLGDLERSRARAEEARAVQDVVPRGSPLDLQIRAVLAAVLAEQGDRQASRALSAESLAAARASLPEGHVDLAIAELNFALEQVRSGEDDAARETLVRILAAPPEGLPRSHPLIVQGRANLAAIDLRTARFDAALATLTELIDELGPDVPRTNPVARALRRNQALALTGLGRRAEADAIELELVAAMREVLPRDHPERLWLELQQASTAGVLGRADEAHAAALEVAGNLRTMLLERALILSPREAESAVQGLRTLLDFALSDLLDPRIGGAGAEAVACAFELSETARGIGIAAQRSASATAAGGESARALREAARARQVELSRAAKGAAPEAVLRGVEARDAAVRALREELARAGAPLRALSAAQLAASLAQDEAAVAWRVRLVSPSDGAAETEATESLCAFVVTPGDPVRCIALGDLEPIAAACRDWRAELERAPHDRDKAAAAGERVRALVVDPVRRAAPRARRWTVTPDGPLLTIPLDALPAADPDVVAEPGAGAKSNVRAQPGSSPRRELGRAEALLGDELRIVTTWSFEEPRARAAEADGAAATVLLCGEPALAPGGRFAPLPAAGRELEAIGAIWKEARGAEAQARTLRGPEATAAAFQSAAVGARWIHVATHGSFEEDAGSKSLLAAPIDDALDPRRSLRGMLPLVRCELVLAQDAEGTDSTASAEELAALDLSACRLAVLSACETGRGEIMLGQGAASFQRALLAAGAQSCLTSLWRVPDDATRELMTAFYRGLWIEHLAPDEALWRAKSALRNRRAPPRDWAAWVLASSRGG